MGAIKINGATSGSTTITAPATGGDESIELSTALASKLDLAGGKILQIVRATDGTDRSTTSTSFIDANISVTITPTDSANTILLVYVGNVSVFRATGGTVTFDFAITDNSNNAISGAEDHATSMQLFSSTGGGTYGIIHSLNLWAYATPATTSATTYKVRYKSISSGTTTIRNATATGQLFAIEVSA